MLFVEVNEEIELLPRESYLGRALTLLGIVIPALHPYKLDLEQNVTSITPNEC